jgi:hypothetical protein
MSVDQKLDLKCKLRDRANPDGRGFVLFTLECRYPEVTR